MNSYTIPPIRSSTPTLREFAWRLAVVIGLLTGSAYLAWLALERPPLGIDDANIFFVYARNLVQGSGLTYNRGGERVEGYSSALWMLIVSAIFALFRQPEVPLLIVSILLLALALTHLWCFVDQGRRVSVLGVLLLVWLVSSPGFIIWNTLTLMDTVLWTALLTITAVEVLGSMRTRRLQILISLILVTRPEGMAWAALFILLASAKSAITSGRATAWRQTRSLAWVFGVVLMGLTVFRVLYFGYPLPNTYYAKVSPDMLYNLKTGIYYLLGFLLYNRLALVGVTVVVTGLALNLRWLIGKLIRRGIDGADTLRLDYSLASVIGFVGLVMPIITGGDHFVFFRFYQPIWPALFLPLACLARLLSREIPAVPKRLRAIGLGAVAVLCLATTYTGDLYQDQMDRIQVEFVLAEQGRALGSALNSIFSPRLPTIGVIAAGGVAFVYQGDVVDLMGLNNVAMAHTPGDRYGMKNHAAFNLDVFLSQKPHLLVHGWSDFLKNAVCSDAFLRQYEPVSISKGRQQIRLYVERDYVTTLLMDGLDIVRVESEVSCANE